MDIEDFSVNREPRARALIPFAVFLVFYLGLSIVSGDFYKVPMPVAFLVASATSLFLSHKASLRSKIELFAHGMGNVDIMVMVTSTSVGQNVMLFAGARSIWL